MDWVLSLTAAIAIVTVAWWLTRYARSVRQGYYRHPKSAKDTWWVAGSGTHGSGGGQVPPLIPDSDEEEIP